MRGSKRDDSYWNLKKPSEVAVFCVAELERPTTTKVHWNLKRRFSLRQRARERHDSHWNLKKLSEVAVFCVVELQRSTTTTKVHWNLKRRSKVVLSTPES